MSNERFRVRLKWRYQDKSGVYEDPPGHQSGWYMEDYDGKKVPDFFAWEEGNDSCDCNRSVMFGLVSSDEESFPCGETIEVYDLEVLP